VRIRLSLTTLDKRSRQPLVEANAIAVTRYQDMAPFVASVALAA